MLSLEETSIMRSAVVNDIATARKPRLRTAAMLRLSTLWEAFSVAASSLRQNKLRTALTLVGIIVGVTAVIAVVTIIKGLDQTVAQTFSSQGSTVFWRTGVAANDAVSIKHENQKADNVAVRGIAPISMFDIDGVGLDVGRFWSDTEGDAAHEVCVVGPDIVTNMFPYHAPDQVVGQDIWAGGHVYKIVGVLQPLGKFFGVSRDNRI